MTVYFNLGANLGLLQLLAFPSGVETALVISWSPAGRMTIGGIPMLPDEGSAAVECVDGRAQVRRARLAQPTRLGRRTFPAGSAMIRYPIKAGGTVAWAHFPRAHTIGGLRLPAGTEVLFDLEQRLRRVSSSTPGVLNVGRVRCRLGNPTSEVLFHENGRLLWCAFPDRDTVAGVADALMAWFYDTGAPCIIRVVDESRREKFTTVAFDRQGRSIPPPRPYACEH